MIERSVDMGPEIMKVLVKQVAGDVEWRGDSYFITNEQPSGWAGRGHHGPVSLLLSALVREAPRDARSARNCGRIIRMRLASRTRFMGRLLHWYKLYR